MKDVCKYKETYKLKVEADITADAIWCNQWHCNFDIEDIPTYIRLKAELAEWILKNYGKCINWDDEIIPLSV